MVCPGGIQAEHGKQDGHIDPLAVHVRQRRLRAEVGLDRLGQDLLVHGVRQEVRTAAEDRPPWNLYTVQAAWANTDCWWSGAGNRVSQRSGGSTTCRWQSMTL